MEITRVHCALRTAECFWEGTHHDKEGHSTGYRSSLKLNASHETPGPKPLVQRLCSSWYCSAAEIPQNGLACISLILHFLKVPGRCNTYRYWYRHQTGILCTILHHEALDNEPYTVTHLKKQIKVGFAHLRNHCEGAQRNPGTEIL